MSSNFWSSSHCKYWLLSRPLLAASRTTDLKYCTPRQLFSLNIFFAQLIQKLGKRLLLRQIPIATACVFFKRFYLKNSICETNPYLVLAACVFVAAKVEETPVHIKSVVSEAKMVFSEHNIKMFPAEPNKLGEMEFYLLEDLDFHLVVFHPYRALLHITGREPADAGKFPKTRVEEDHDVRRKEAGAKKSTSGGASASTATSAGAGAVGGVGGARGAAGALSGGREEEGEDGESEEERIRRLMGRGSCEGMMDVDEGILQISWFILNDSYRTDVHLLYPPYIIALSATYIAFCLTSMNASSSSSSRTRSSSSQVHTLATALSTNEALHLPPPPSGTAEFLASFEVSLPVLFACVQDLISLYPAWEGFEPSTIRQNPQAATQAAAQGSSGISAGNSATAPATAQAALAKAASLGGQGNGKTGQGQAAPKFGPEEAEALVRRMIEERMVDVGHPDNAGKNERDRPGSAGNGVAVAAAGKKRGRV